MGNMKHRRGIDSFLVLAHVGLCAVLIIAACGQLRSANAFNINHGFAVTSKIAANDRGKVFIGGHGAVSSGGYDKPSQRDPHPPGVNHHGAHHDHLGLPTSSRGFIGASRRFSSPDASSSDGDGLADKDDGIDENISEDAGGFDFSLLDDDDNSHVQVLKGVVLRNIQGEAKCRTLVFLRYTFRDRQLYNALTGLDQFDTDDEFAVRVIAHIVGEDEEAVKRQYGLTTLNKYRHKLAGATIGSLKKLKNKIFKRPRNNIDKQSLSLDKLVFDVQFWKYIKDYEDKLNKETFEFLIDIKQNILEKNWNLTSVEEKCGSLAELKFLGFTAPRASLLEVLDCILESSDKTTKETIECRLSAFKGFIGKVLKSFDVVYNNGRNTSYFIGNPCFRHEAIEGAVPPLVFLSKETAEGKSKRAIKEPFLLYSASGTGKTVEIAGSGSTRDAVLTIVYTASEDTDRNIGTGKEMTWDTCEDLLKEFAARYVSNNNDYSKILKPIINDVYQKDKEMQDSSIEAAELNGVGNVDATENNMISIVFAIDEIAVCPEFVRSIIAHYKEAGKAMAEVFCGDQLDNDQELKYHKVEVLFSFAGTGGLTATIASKPENYEAMDSSAKLDGAEAYEALRKGTDNADMLPTYQELAKGYPVLDCVVKHNARMASIFVATLSSDPRKITHPNTQNELIGDVFTRFIESNGLSRLTTCTDQITVAAQTLAVHLFQHKVDIGTYENEAAVRKYRYGIEFDPHTDLEPTSLLVTPYALLTPKNLRKGCAEKPFVVDEAMQLLCLWMLMQGNKQGYNGGGRLEKSPTGIEALTTQIVNAVVAASMTLPVDSRPTMATLLKDNLNFFMVGDEHHLRMVAEEAMDKLRMDAKYEPAETHRSEMVTKIRQNEDFEMVLAYYENHKKELQQFDEDENMTNMMKAFDEYIDACIETLEKEAEVFAPFQNVMAVPITYVEGTESWGTYFQKSEMDVKEFTFEHINMWKEMFDDQATVSVYHPVDYAHRENVPYDEVEGATVVCIDAELRRRLFGMKATAAYDSNNGETPQSLSVPLTTLASRASQMADGYLVFYGQRVRDGKLVGHAFRCCVALQVKDSLFGTRDFPFDTSIVDNNQARMEDPVLDDVLGEARIYCHASYDEKPQQLIDDSGTHVIEFPVHKSPILPSMMTGLSKYRDADYAAYHFGTRTYIIGEGLN